MTSEETDEKILFDAIVIGTGFAGAVTAARLVQAGMKVCVLERGRKYEGNDFPMYPDAEALLALDGGTKPAGGGPDLARWLWSIDQGIYDVRDLDDVVSVQAAGYGGGSLIYANVHLRAPDEVFRQGWPAVYRRETLDPCYDRVAFMLDVRPVPKNEELPKAAQLKGLAGQGALADLVQAIDPPLAVTFKDEDPNERLADRPWTDLDRLQKACDMRGFCWLGCRQGAKNSLDFNYLRIVEMARDDGALAHIHLGAEVVKIERLGTDENAARYRVHCRDRLANPKSEGLSYQAKNVFLAAGAVNTTELLLRSKNGLKPDKAAWAGLGSHYYPNADSLAAVFDCAEPKDADHGPTITSALLHRKPRTEGEKQLWVIDFCSTFMIEDSTIAALAPGAHLHLGTRTDSTPDPDDKIQTLVEPLDFDVGGFDEKLGVAMLVVEAGEHLKEPRGKLLSVRVNRDEWRTFGTIIGKPRRLEDWFLIEDGGYPTDIEPLLGILRSPLWLRRNRFIERGDGETLVDRQDAHPFGDTGPLRFPLATAMESFFGVPRRSTRVSTNLGDISAEDELLAASPLDISLNEILPPWFLEALAADRAELAKALAPMVGQMLEAVLDNVAERLVQRFDAMALTYNFTDSIGATLGDIPEKRRADLIRGLLRQAIQVLWGSEVAMAESVNQLLIDRVPKDAYGLAQLMAPLAGWLLNYREGNGRTGLLLAMGRDQYRGRLRIDDATGRLTARLPKPLAPTSRVAQEQVMRAIAREWRGELRTNPAWTALNRRITVHSQGGCPMCRCGACDAREGKGPSDDACVCAAVTRPNGEVIGCDGLYVMDAAAFPAAVGVNPSATIAAVAEYKVKKFIESQGSDEVRQAWKDNCTPTSKAFDRWIAALKDDYGDPKHVLDPLAAVDSAPQSDPGPESLGLEFKESVAGYCAPCNASFDWDKLAEFGEHKDTFARAERQGIEDRGTLALELTARIDDLDRFFRTQRRGFALKMSLEGSVAMGGGEAQDVDRTSSYLQIFLRPPPAHDSAARDHAEPGKPPCFFRYHVVVPGKQPFWVEGLKFLSDDPRFDIWQDLTTLYVERFEGDPAGDERPLPSWRGILRVAPSDFFQKQLKSISITPEEADSARKSWAYGGFIRYFADELADVYLERRGLIGAMVKNLLDPSRGG